MKSVKYCFVFIFCLSVCFSNSILAGECPPTGLTCELTKPIQPGKPFYFGLIACNNLDEPLEVSLLVALDILGCYFFYPSWSQNIDSYTWTLPPCSCIDIEILNFIWPGSIPPVPLAFWSVMTNEDFTQLIGNIGYCATY